MQTRKPINIPVVSAPVQENPINDTRCSGSEMGAPATQGSFVIATLNGEFIFRQLMRDEQLGWQLHALNPAYPDAAIPNLNEIKGLITHKKKSGSRKSVKYYVTPANA